MASAANQLDAVAQQLQQTRTSLRADAAEDSGLGQLLLQFPALLGDADGLDELLFLTYLQAQYSIGGWMEALALFKQLQQVRAHVGTAGLGLRYPLAGRVNFTSSCRPIQPSPYTCLFVCFSALRRFSAKEMLTSICVLLCWGFGCRTVRLALLSAMACCWAACLSCWLCVEALKACCRPCQLWTDATHKVCFGGSRVGVLGFTAPRRFWSTPLGA